MCVMTTGNEQLTMATEDTVWEQNATIGHGLPGPQEVERLYIKQKISPVMNKYWVHLADEEGKPGDLLLFADQKIIALKEKIDFFSDESKSALVLRTKSRHVVDLAATTDVYNADGETVAIYRKDGVASLLNSTWHLETPGLRATGRERSKGMAMTRRFSGLVPVVGELLEAIPWQFHFDFYDASEQLVMSDERQFKIFDNYLITLPKLEDGSRMDWRAAATLGVALDAFQGR